MSVTITLEHVYFFSVMVLMLIQIYQHTQLEKTKKEIKQIWDQISTFNTMVALKLLETQKDIAKLNENKDKDGKYTQKDS